MYELSTFYPDISGIQAEYGWDASSVRASHGLPVIGPHRNFPHHLFAFADYDAVADQRLSGESCPLAPPPRRAAAGRRRIRIRTVTGTPTDEDRPLDLLAFGPHPDDLEIGLAGTIARHVASGQRVGLCDLTAGEMGSNGTVDERLSEARRQQPFSARCGARTCAGRIDGSRGNPAVWTLRSVHPPPSSSRGCGTVLVRSSSRSRGGKPAPDRGGIQRRAAEIPGGGRRVEGRLGLLLLHQ